MIKWQLIMLTIMIPRFTGNEEHGSTNTLSGFRNSNGMVKFYFKIFVINFRYSKVVIPFLSHVK